MSIYPKGVSPQNLMYKFDYAALNLPVPDDLTDEKDATEWRCYLDNISPAQQVRALAQALDQFHRVFDNQQTPVAPREMQAYVYSKWYAASIANAALAPKFHWVTAEMNDNPRMFHSDIERGVYCLTEFLKSVNSADTIAWETRLEQHRAIDRKALLPILNDFSGLTAARASARPQGNAP